MLAEDERRQHSIEAQFKPLTGQGAPGERQEVTIPDFMDGQKLWLPVSMLNESVLLQKVLDAGSVKDFILTLGYLPYPDARTLVNDALLRVRLRHDFPFACAACFKIKAKEGGADIPFILNRPQRTILLPSFEKDRLAHRPIRKILLKARQLGGSTLVQMYFTWLQLCVKEGLNSLIVGHQSAASVEVVDMLKRALTNFPIDLLYPLGESHPDSEQRFVSVFGNNNTYRIPQRNCKVKLGSAESPQSARGGSYSLCHLTEVGLWRKTEGRSPADLVASATSGVLYREHTMIVYESTAKGEGTFFHKEYLAATEGISQFDPLFVSWKDIDNYTLPFDSDEERKDFAIWLYNERDSITPANNRCESGQYLWNQWLSGATLEGLHWYVAERSKYDDHVQMASEYPSDAIEAFSYNGTHVFNRNAVEAMRPSCREMMPKVGQLVGAHHTGAKSLKDLQFIEGGARDFTVWEKPDISLYKPMRDRYVVAVDIGSRSPRSDWSVVSVIDRFPMMSGQPCKLVAQMRAHTDHDLLAWYATRIAMWYDNALLVFESNTLESRDAVDDGDTSSYILNQVRDVYDNLYARRQSAEDIRQGMPRKYGFHTNRQTKPALIANLVRLVREHAFTERDEGMISEMLQYEYKPNGTMGAIDGAHDDRIMSRAIALYVSDYEMELPTYIKTHSFKPTRQGPVNEARI